MNVTGSGEARLEGLGDVEVVEGDLGGLFGGCDDGAGDLKRLGVQNGFKSESRAGQVFSFAIDRGLRC
jgi:hypothetical protein